MRRLARSFPWARHLASAASVALVIAGALGPRAARAYEVDNFTGREGLTKDALGVLDRKVNEILRRAMVFANRESPDRCGRVHLRQEIVRWTGPDPISLLEFWATSTDEIQHTTNGISESVYAGATLFESPSMWFSGIGRSLLLAGHIVGTDKLGHFFMQGLDYYKRVSHDGADLDHVLRYEHGEEGIWGLSTSGVKSYADMAANYQGYRFWKQLYEGADPYARCENGRKWVPGRAFTWADYVNDAWDEAINCSEMKPSLAARFAANMKKAGFRCPIDPQRCIALNRLEKAEHFVNPACQTMTGPPRK